jgi:hypothetical protein
MLFGRADDYLLMIEKLIRVLIAAAILALIGWGAKLLIIAIGAPVIVWTIVLVLLILIFALYLAKTFGVFP